MGRDLGPKAPCASGDPMERGAGTLVLIPARNEADRLPAVLEGIRRTVPAAEIVVVDDASTDGTAEAARRWGAAVLSLPVHSGYGGALKAGYRYAAGRGAGAVVQLDADGQHDPLSIPVLLDALLEEGLDLVIGSRFLGGGTGGSAYDMPATRRWGVAVLRWVTGRLLRQRLTDPTSGYQALSRRLVDFYVDWERFPQDFPDADVLVWIARNGFRIGEVPALMHERSGGRSMHRGLRPLLYAMKMGLTLPLSASLPVRSLSPLDGRGEGPTAAAVPAQAGTSAGPEEEAP